MLGHAPSAELAGQVYERSGGNAFLAEELLAARERDVLVPGTVQSLVLARVAGLTAPARDLVRLAAVAGVRVSHGLLATASGLDDEVLLAAARELAENHLLVADRSGEGYAFRHTLTREAVYGDLLPGERQKLHRGGGPGAQRRTRRWGRRRGGRWLRRWPSTGSPPVSSNERCRPRSRPVMRLERCWPSPARSVTTSGRWICGIGWPTRRGWPAWDVPSCSIEQLKWPAGPVTTSGLSATSTPPSLSWSALPPRRRQLALLYAAEVQLPVLERPR